MKRPARCLPGGRVSPLLATAVAAGLLAAGLLAAGLLAAGGALAEGERLGGSLLTVFPFGSLTDRDDQFGVPVLPGPGVGVRLRLAPAQALMGACPELSLDVAMFRTNSDRDLELLYVPVLAGLSRDVADIVGVSVSARIAAGPGFLSSSSGERRSLGTGVVMLGWEFAREMEGSVASLQFGIDLLNQRWPLRRMPGREGAWAPRGEGGVRVCVVLSTK